MEIFSTNDSFSFEKLVLTKPILISGGNYFIRCLMNSQPLYIQPPKCKTRQGIVKAGKRLYSDLMFTNENEDFIRWMENLENYCQKKIYENREKWFETELDEHDIENSFTSPLKLFKSGKFYISRTNVPTILGNCSLKIYNENEEEVPIENIVENTNVMTILEIQGIKCSARNFQIEIELKQIMVLKPLNLFEKCIFKSKSQNNFLEEMPEIKKINTIPDIIKYDSNSIQEETYSEPEYHHNLEESLEFVQEQQYKPEPETETVLEMQKNIESEMQDNTNFHNNSISIVQPELEENKEKPDILEIEFDVNKLPEDDTIKIKKRNDIYYEMYKEAKRKAKLARDLALSSYLEAKHIKNTFLINDVDNDESDLDDESFEKLQK